MLGYPSILLDLSPPTPLLFHLVSVLVVSTSVVCMKLIIQGDQTTRDISTKNRKDNKKGGGQDSHKGG